MPLGPFCCLLIAAREEHRHARVEGFSTGLCRSRVGSGAVQQNLHHGFVCCGFACCIASVACVSAVSAFA